jgi:hypothetical protein
MPAVLLQGGHSERNSTVLAAIHCHLAGRSRLCRWLAAGGMGQV